MPELGEKLFKPEISETRLTYLRTRRSNLAKLMQAPGPDAAHIQDMLTIAARVPDHRKLAPWRFVIFQGDARLAFGQHIAQSFARTYPDIGAERTEFESQRLARAPLVICVISSPKVCPRGTPMWEQHLSAGAVCYNLCLAAQAHGFGAQWLTEWISYDPEIHSALSMTESEQIAGFIYIGSVDDTPTERARPDIEPLVTEWTA